MTMTIAVMDERDVEVIREEVAPVIAHANGLTVASAEQYQDAADFLKRVKGAQKMVTDHFAPMKTAAHAAWKTICAKENEAQEPLTAAEKTVKSRMLTWYQEQERIRREQERKLQAEAEARARQERERLEKAAAKLKTEELREQRMEEAQQVVAAPVYVAPTAPAVKGQSIRRVWRAKVSDPQAAIAALMQWPDWQAYISINEGELHRFAARTKGQVQVPGVEFSEEANLSSRGA